MKRIFFFFLLFFLFCRVSLAGDVRDVSDAVDAFVSQHASNLKRMRDETAAAAARMVVVAGKQEASEKSADVEPNNNSNASNSSSSTLQEELQEYLKSLQFRMVDIVGDRPRHSHYAGILQGMTYVVGRLAFCVCTYPSFFYECAYPSVCVVFALSHSVLPQSLVDERIEWF